MEQRRFKIARQFMDYLGQHPKRLLLASAAILILGFLWQLLVEIHGTPDSKSLAFPRSGSVLIMLAISSVFFNHILRQIRSKQETFITQLDHPPTTLQAGVRKVMTPKINREVGRLLLKDAFDRDSNFEEKIASASGANKEAVLDQAAELLGKARLDSMAPEIIDEPLAKYTSGLQTKVLNAKDEVRNLEETEINIAFTELSAGLAGTFIWAFGDIVFNLLYATGAAGLVVLTASAILCLPTVYGTEIKLL